MNIWKYSLFATALSVAFVPANANLYENRNVYLEQIKDVCSVECLKPREFRKKARKQASKDNADLAVMMDVRSIRRDGDKFVLLSLDLTRSDLETLAVLGAAGIDTSGRTGVGGLPRGDQAGTHPDMIVIEIDAQAVTDLLRAPAAPVALKSEEGLNGDIIVESQTERQVDRSMLAGLKTALINRRIVVRGSPRLQPTWVGGRLDYRNKQVTLEVDNADDLVMLPRYDEDGQPIFDGPLASLRADYGKK